VLFCRRKVVWGGGNGVCGMVLSVLGLKPPAASWSGTNASGKSLKVELMTMPTLDTFLMQGLKVLSVGGDVGGRVVVVVALPLLPTTAFEKIQTLRHFPPTSS
jgi:hypothetical protein